MGTSGLTAQAIGERDSDEVSALLIRGLMIGAAAGLVFIILQIPLFWLGFQLSPASAEVEGLAARYMEIRIWGAPAAIAAFAMTGWLIAAERTRRSAGAATGDQWRKHRAGPLVCSGPWLGC